MLFDFGVRSPRRGARSAGGCSPSHRQADGCLALRSAAHFATDLHRREVPLDDIAAFLGHTPRLRITAMDAKRGPENVARALAAIDQYLSELRTLVDAGAAEHAGGPICGRSAVDDDPGEIAKPWANWWS